MDAMLTDTTVSAPDWAPPPLPRSLSSFVGRRQEIADIVGLLGGDVPLVTLVGPGGVGKTRLALQVGEAIAALRDGRFRDGVAFVRLETVQQPTLVASHVAQSLGLQEQANRTAEQVLLHHLRRRNLLLVLDNFEHVLEAATLVHDLLESSSGLAVLATSRVPLNLTGEYLYPVDPLALPKVPALAAGDHEPAAAEDVTAVAASDAGRLFLERARARNPRFTLTPDNARAVARLCVRLDGLPLAIELAAGRLRTMAPQGLQNLEALLPSLDKGPRDAPLRHLTVRSTLAWSYDRLPPEQQRVFRSLGVFVGGFTLEAAMAVAGGHAGDSSAGTGDVQDTARAEQTSPEPTGAFINDLRALADQSLIRVDVTADDERRYGLLETTREYALELLAMHDELRRAREAQVTYFAAWLQDAEAGLVGSDYEIWGKRVDADLANIRVSLDWALSSGGSLLETGLQMAVALWPYWDRRGYRQEAERWLRRALEHSVEGRQDLRAAITRRLGNALDDNRPREALAYYADGLALARESGAGPLAAALLRNLGGLSGIQGNYDEATRCLQEALGIYSSLSDDLGFARTLVSQGVVECDAGNIDRARSRVEEALAVFERLRDPEAIVGAYFELGRIDRRAGRLEDAAAQFQQGTRLAEAAGEAEWLAYGRHEAATLAHLQGDDRLALRLLVEALRALQRTGTDFGIVLCLDEFAAIAVAQDQPELAATIWGSVEAWRETTGTALAEAEKRRRLNDVAVGRAKLGKERWEAAWRRGRALQLENVAALATQIQVTSRPNRLPPVASTQPARTPLTSREIQVLRLVAENLTDKEIGERLSISRRTVTTHMENIFTKLDARGRVEAALYASRYGLLSDDRQAVTSGR